MDEFYILRLMSDKYSIASRRRWIGIPKEERQKRMSKLAKKRWANMTPEQRKAMISKMVKARKNGKKET